MAQLIQGKIVWFMTGLSWVCRVPTAVAGAAVASGMEPCSYLSKIDVMLGCLLLQC
jgi:hypothetical protein